MNTDRINAAVTFDWTIDENNDPERGGWAACGSEEDPEEEEKAWMTCGRYTARVYRRRDGGLLMGTRITSVDIWDGKGDAHMTSWLPWKKTPLHVCRSMKNVDVQGMLETLARQFG